MQLYMLRDILEIKAGANKFFSQPESQCPILHQRATAIRFAELADVAVAVSTGAAIDYCFMSDAMKSLPKLDWIRKGSPLPKGTATARLAARSEAVLAGERVAEEVDVSDWLGGTTKATVLEEAVGLGRYGKVPTILVSTSIGQDEDPDDYDKYENLIESWTPRFRR